MVGISWQPESSREIMKGRPTARSLAIRKKEDNNTNSRPNCTRNMGKQNKDNKQTSPLKRCAIEAVKLANSEDSE